jgi:hypothetical protein
MKYNCSCEKNSYFQNSRTYFVIIKNIQSPNLMEDKNIEENSMEVTIGRVRSDSGLGRFDLLEEIGSDRVRVRSGQVNLHIVFFQNFDRF